VVQAYILIQTEVGKASAVAAEISGLPGCWREDVTGPYDVIVRAEADSMDNLGRLVGPGAERSRITRTLTCPWCTLS